MATVRLSEYECRRGLLPRVCMKCGAEAHETVRRNFSWYPQWVPVLIVAGLLVFIIVAMIMTKKMLVPVPLCEEHKGHWKKRALFLGLSFLALVLIAVGGFAIAASLPKPNDDAMGFTCLGSLGLGIVWLIGLVISNQGAIRPTEITERHIKLTNVNEGFVEAVEEDRDRDREERDRDREARRAVRNDTDDDRRGYDDRPRRRDDEYDDRPRRRRDRDDNEYDDRPRRRPD